MAEPRVLYIQGQNTSVKSPVTILLLYTSFFCFAQKNVITSDIPNFWRAYDLVQQSTDSAEQIRILNKEFIEKGTEGLKGIMQARNYQTSEYLAAIKSYPEFWKSIRASTLKADLYASDIEKGIAQLAKLYPPLKPAKLYFTVGALRTGGTTLKDKVLIGSEISMADSATVVREFGKNFSHLAPYFATNPFRHLAFLNVHEYIHTQQRSSIGQSLLAQTLIEGAAEFVASKALNCSSPNAQISFGKAHTEKIKQAYVRELFSTYLYNWIWNSPDNEFQMRDLAYFVGYAICESYYERAKDKQKAIQEMIELDCNNAEHLYAFVDASGFFEKTLRMYQKEQETLRPYVTRIEPFDNGTQQLHPDTKSLTLYFSEAMNKGSGDFDAAPVGREHTLWIKKHQGFSEDGKSYTIELQPLEKGKHYQLQVVEGFLSEKGYPLKPYLIDVTTAK